MKMHLSFHPKFTYQQFLNCPESPRLSRLECQKKVMISVLKNNLSFYFESEFRLGLQEALEKWMEGRTSFQEAYLELENIFQRRNWFARKIIKSKSIGALVASFGFFSFGQELTSLADRVTKDGYLQTIANLQTWPRERFWDIYSVYRISRKLVHGTSSRADIVKMLKMRKIQLSRKPTKMLVIGPGEIDKNIQNWSGEVLILVTPNTNLLETKSRLGQVEGVYLFVNNEVARDLVEKGEDSISFVFRGTLRGVYCHQRHVDVLSEILSCPVLPRESELVKGLFIIGAPNLLQLSVGKLIEVGVSPVVTGVSLYVGNSIYRGSNAASGFKPMETADFKTCAAMVFHNPITNFLFLSSLESEGFMECGPTLRRTLRMDNRSYLKELDLGLGRKRA